MKHFGDITKLSGYDLPIVDIITGGSPCQDLSVAGKRAGLAGERSGLFMEQMRIVKEMRERDRATGRADWLVRPRFMVWENVPGAFSSGKPKGADFAAVIEEIIKVCEPWAVVHVCVPDRGWQKSGCYYAEDGSWSIAWRVHDAQFWGVPQRRKRIALVADFGGLSATEILFERQGLRRDTAESRAQGEGTAGGTEKSAGGAISFQERAGKPGGGKGILIQEERVGALSTLSLAAEPGMKQQTYVFENHSQDSRNNPMGEICETVSAKYGTGDTTQITSDKNWSNPHYGDPCHPLAAGAHPPAVSFSMHGFGDYKQSDGASSCKMRDYKDSTDLIVAVDFRNGTENPETNGTLQAKESGGQSINYQNTLRIGSAVRRLTPTECERLQGYPDGWTDIGDWTDSKGKKRKAADGPRYKALGNSIALPFWAWLARRICAQYERPMTMASLFDGIGGFPLAFSMAGCNPVWASEIEEFPIAVTKIRLGDE